MCGFNTQEAEICLFLYICNQSLLLMRLNFVYLNKIGKFSCILAMFIYYLFTYGLLRDAVSISDCITLNASMISE
jgi:hypothetical protein